MDFFEKSFKLDNKWDKQWQIIVEAFSCVVKHLGIIRLMFINQRTIKGYLLWWNDKFVLIFWQNYNAKVSKLVLIEKIEKKKGIALTLDELEMVAMYSKNCMDLILSLLVIVGNATKRTISTMASYHPMSFCILIFGRRIVYT